MDFRTSELACVHVSVNDDDASHNALLHTLPHNAIVESSRECIWHLHDRTVCIVMYS